MNCFEKLGLQDTATIEDVKKAWRELATTHHPDHGGDATKFSMYRVAYRSALALIGKKDCSQCLGTRKVPAQGFTSTYINCPHCVGEAY